ncbi:unnamed protein product [Meganyctiphanes norvegica]|uniref:Uncharacterized protein n=1 Tax=Meganyctiphanes norvegica TaxID=48144 RepID=A0AAV2SLG4_MEGNR
MCSVPLLSPHSVAPVSATVLTTWCRFVLLSSQQDYYSKSKKSSHTLEDLRCFIRFLSYATTKYETHLAAKINLGGRKGQPANYGRPLDAKSSLTGSLGQQNTYS